MPNLLKCSSGQEDYNVKGAQMKYEQLTEELLNSWRKKEPGSRYNDNQESISFQLIDVDNGYVDNNNGKGSNTVIRLYGATEEGHSVCCLVADFNHYFYASVSPNMEPHQCDILRTALNRQLGSNPVFGQCQDPIRNIEIVQKRCMIGYTGGAKSPFIKITVALPNAVQATKYLLDSGKLNMEGLGDHPYSVFEGDVEPEHRFMIDKDITGCGWVTVPKGKYRLQSSEMKTSSCQVEIQADFNDIKCPDRHVNLLQSHNAPIRILSVDIECQGRAGIFPVAINDPVIQIGNVLVQERHDNLYIIFTVNTCAPVESAHVTSYRDEREMLMAWKNFVLKVDADILTGYNVNKFDLHYLIDRAVTLGLDNFNRFGRIVNAPSVVKNLLYKRSWQNPEYVHVPGRVVLDLYQVIKSEYHLPSYKLNEVCIHFLNKEKEALHHSKINDLQLGDEYNRHEIAEYCLKDAHLCIALIEHLALLHYIMELAKATGVQLRCILSKANSTQVASLLIREGKHKDYLLPNMIEKDIDCDWDKSTDFEPVKGFYLQPVVCFKSISPISKYIMSHNVCPTTLVRTIGNIEIDHSGFLAISPNYKVVDQSIQRGILPMILERLLDGIKWGKIHARIEINPDQLKLAQAHVRALEKVDLVLCSVWRCNFVAFQFDEISNSLVLFARESAAKIKNILEAKCSRNSGYPHDSSIIFGNWRQFLVTFGPENQGTAVKLANSSIDLFRKCLGIKLELDHIKQPLLLIDQTKQASVKYTTPNGSGESESHGLVPLQKNSCSLVKFFLDSCLDELLLKKSYDASGALLRKLTMFRDDKYSICDVILTRELTQNDICNPTTSRYYNIAWRHNTYPIARHPRVGDLVQYIVVNSENDDDLVIEHPDFILQNNFRIDAEYYIQNHLKEVLMPIFKIVDEENAEALFKRH